MFTYTVTFKLKEDSYEFSMESPNEFNSETGIEILKDEAATIIEAFRQEYPALKEMPAYDIKLYRDNQCLLDCYDLSKNSINRIK